MIIEECVVTVLEPLPVWLSLRANEEVTMPNFTTADNVRRDISRIAFFALISDEPSIKMKRCVCSYKEAPRGYPTNLIIGWFSFVTADLVFLCMFVWFLNVLINN